MALKDDLRASEALRQMGREIRLIGAKPQLVREYIETAYASTTTDPLGDMADEVFESLIRRQRDLPAIMDIADGDIQWIAGQVVGLMFAGYADGHDFSIDDAINTVEMRAMEYRLR